MIRTLTEFSKRIWRPRSNGNSPCRDPVVLRDGGLGIVLLAIFIGLAAFYGYQLLFSTFAGYDDEGYVMLSLKHVMQGEPLYDKTYSQYGPAFFQIQSLFHWVSNSELSHDLTRFKTLGMWLSISLVGALFVWQVTRFKLLGIAAFGMIFCHLDRLSLEPGHPQELCAFVLVSVLGLSAVATSENRPTPGKSLFAIAAGGLIAVVVFTKINVGLILALPLALVLCASRRQSQAWRCLTGVFAGSCLLLVGMFAWKSGVRAGMPMIVGMGLVSALLIQRNRPAVQKQDWNPILVGIGFGSVSVVVLTIAVLQGTTLKGLVEGVVLQHLGFGNYFFSPVRIPSFSIAAGLLGIVLAWMACQGSKQAVSAARIALALLLLVTAATSVFDSFSSPNSGFEDRNMALWLTGLVPGFAWVVMIPGQTEPPRRFPRELACFIAVFQPLTGYPTPGTQVAVGSMLLLLVTLIAFSDAISGQAWFGISVPKSQRLIQGPFLPAACLVGIMLLTLGLRGHQLTERRNRMTFLNLPGAQRLKLPAEKVNAIRSLVEFLDAESDTFLFGENTRNSFYFWSNKKPPNSLNATAWPYMLCDEQQQKIIKDLAKFDRVMVLRDQHTWPLPDDSPLLNWIERNCYETSATGPFRIWLNRNDVSRSHQLPAVVEGNRSQRKDSPAPARALIQK